MNRLSFPRPARLLCPRAALSLLLTILPGIALAQKTTVAPPPAPDAAAALGQKQKEMLAQDKRLDRPVTLDLISVPLGEVLQQQSVDKSTDKMEDGNKFVLTAAPDCADLKMQIRLNKRPLRTLMQAIAEMLPGVWTPTRHGYQLAMTKQAADARAEWWRLFLGEREKALALQRQAVLAAMQTKARRRQIGDPEPAEATDHAVDEELANQHDFFHTLPQPLKEQIAADMDETAFDEVGRVGFGNGGELSGTYGWLSQMSPETQEKFKTALQDNINNHLAPLPPTLQKYAIQAQQGLAALDPSRIFFCFENGGTGVLATPFNGPPGASTILELSVPETLSLPVLLLDQTQLADQVLGGGDLPPGWKRKAEDLRKSGDAVPPVWRQLVYDVYGMGDAAPLEWKQLAAYQRGRVWPNTLPKLPREDGHLQQFVISRAGRMDWLGEQGHMEYVCDYYSQGGYALPADQKKLPVKRPLAKELDEIAARHDVSWTKDADGVYLVRNNRWYRDDGLEVPQPLLHRWFTQELQTRRQEIARQQQAAQIGKPATPPEERAATQRRMWDWAAEVFGALTPWQIRNGLAQFQPEEKDLTPLNDDTAAKLNEKLKHRVPQPGEVVPPGWDDFAEATRRPPFWLEVNVFKGFPHTAQLYGSLDDAGRTALLAGRLPASTLGPSQLAQAISLQPFLPQALQHFPPESVLLGLTPRMRLEITTPPAPQNAP